MSPQTTQDALLLSLHLIKVEYEEDIYSPKMNEHKDTEI